MEPATGRTQAEWWQSRWFAVAAVLLACAPLLQPAFPPLTDALDHAARYRVMLDGGSGPLAQWYSVRWRLVGNLGVDVLILGVAPLIGLEPAVKAVAIGIVALTVSGCLALSRAAHGRVSPYALFALPLAYNHVFHMGFLNFTLAMALALHALALWIRMAGSRWRGLVFVAVALAIWATHVFGWAVLALTAFAGEVARRRALFASAVACVPLAAPLPLMLVWGAASSGATFGFLDVEAKALALLMSFRDTWFAVDALTLLIAIGAILHGVARAGTSRTLGAAALALLGAFLLLPAWLMGSAMADARAAPYVVILGLLAIAPGAPRIAGHVAAAGLAFFVARIAVTTVSLSLASAAQAREAHAIDHIPVGSRVVMFVSPDCDTRWSVSRRDHIGGLAQVRARAFVNSQWPDVGASLLVTHYPAARGFANDPSQLLPCDGGAALAQRLARVPWEAFDRLWLVDLPEGVPPALPGLTRVWADGDSAVYRLDRR